METDGDNVCGGCEGPEAMYVKLISSDGHEFFIKREYALTSGTIKEWLDTLPDNPRLKMFFAPKKFYYTFLELNTNSKCRN